MIGPVLIQNKGGQANGQTYLNTPKAGRLLIATFSWRSATGAGAPTGWNTRKLQGSLGGDGVAIFEKISDGTETSVSMTGTVANVTEELYEVSGMQADVTSEYDNSSGATLPAASTFGQPTIITPSQMFEFFVVVIGHGSGTHTPYGIDSGFTLLDTATFTRAAHGYKIKDNKTKDAENPIMTFTSGDGYIAMAAFKPLPTPPQGMARTTLRPAPFKPGMAR